MNWHENLYYFRALQHVHCVYDGAEAWKNQIDLIQICYSDEFFPSQMNSGCQINSVPTWQGQDKLISLSSMGCESFVWVLCVRVSRALLWVAVERGVLQLHPNTSLPARWEHCQWKVWILLQSGTEDHISSALPILNYSPETAQESQVML